MDDSTTIQILAVCTVVLYFKFVFSTVKQQGSRTAAPEDGGAHKEDAGASESQPIENSKAKFDAGERANRIVANDMENILIGLILYWAAYIARGNNYVTAISIIVFTLGRIGHTFFYSKGIQPWRSISWFVALLCNVTVAVNLIVGAFTN